jgi:TRAP-type C4-dicarboxylate transport system permease small subunit
VIAQEFIKVLEELSIFLFISLTFTGSPITIAKADGWPT